MEHTHTEGTFINAKIRLDQKINDVDYKRVCYGKTVRYPSDAMIAYFERRFIAATNPK